MEKKLYVGNLSYKLTEQEVGDAFAAFGTVVSVKMVTDRDTGRPKGFGFVEMSTEAEAQAAIEGMNGKAMDGRNITVNEARPKPEGGGRGFGGGGGGFRGGDRGGFRGGDRGDRGDRGHRRF